MFPCEIQHQGALPTLSIRFRTPVQELPRHLEEVYRTIGQYFKSLGEHPAGGVFAAYHNMDMSNLDVEAGFTVVKPLPGKGEILAGFIPGGTFAICHYTGPYDAAAPAYEALTQFAREKGYKVGGVIYEWYLNGPETPPQELETDIAYPVTRDSARVGV